MHMIEAANLGVLIRPSCIVFDKIPDVSPPTAALSEDMPFP